jgi:GT2 family glycosyltransferase
MSEPSFTIVIPLHRDGPMFRRCLEACLAQDYPDFETVVATDRPLQALPEGVRVIKTGGAAANTSPAEKRDRAFAATSSDVIAFIDDDAYPSRDWLTSAARHLADPTVKALGGPGLTPPHSSWRERVGGAVYESPAGSAQLRFRFLQRPPREVLDYPAYNLFVRRDALEAVGGWGTTLYGGEDTVLCLKLAEAGWPVHYAPDVVVFHHRRPILASHLRQVANVGRHRGYFVRAFPRTSRRMLYALPALGPIVLTLAALAGRQKPRLGVSLAFTTCGLVAAESLRRHPPSVALVVPFVTAAHHVAYGSAFIRGLLSREMSR